MKDETARFIRELFSDNRLLLVLALVFAVWLFTRALQSLSEMLAKKFVRYRLFISSLFPILRLLTWVFAIPMIIFGVIHPPLNTVLAISASAGLAVGLGAQDLIKNILSGTLILFDRPFRVGDMIHAGDHYGEVTDIGLRSVKIRTFDDSSVTLPNSLVLSQAIANSNTGALDELVVAEIILPASLDIQLIKDLAWEAAACSPYVYLKKPITVIAEDHFDRTFLTRYKVKAYVLDVRYERLFASDIIERIKHEINRRHLLPETLVAGLLAVDPLPLTPKAGESPSEQETLAP